MKSLTRLPALLLLLIAVLATFAAPPPPAIDPATGLPVTASAPAWKDTDWKDPEKKLAEVNYDSINIDDVARQLRQEFKDAFDIIIPNTMRDPQNPENSLNPRDFQVRLQLKNVSVSEVFNAMNIMFEGDNLPCHWELRLNGKRPTAILRLEQLPPPVKPAVVPVPPVRLVYFVGDLLGDEKSGNFSMEQLVKTVTEVYQMSYGPAKGTLQFHKDAQLLVFTGTEEQATFLQGTLSALRQRAAHKRDPNASANASDPSAVIQFTAPVLK